MVYKQYYCPKCGSRWRGTFETCPSCENEEVIVALISKTEFPELVKETPINLRYKKGEQEYPVLNPAIWAELATKLATSCKNLQPKGKWIKNDEYVYVCSVCDKEALNDEYGEQTLSPYCGVCGAKMDEVEE